MGLGWASSGGLALLAATVPTRQAAVAAHDLEQFDRGATWSRSITCRPSRVAWRWGWAVTLCCLYEVLITIGPMLTTLFFMVTVLLGSALAGESRLALLIGNQSYPGRPAALERPHADVAALQTALEEADFDVRVVKDADATAIRGAVETFAETLKQVGDDATAFFYYAGHGAVARAELRDRNFLLPANTEVTNSSSVIGRGVRLDVLVDIMGAAQPKNLFVVYDACRNTVGRGDRGLARMFIRPGMLIAMSTMADATTPDDGAYAMALAQQIRKPGQRADVAFLLANGTVSDARAYHQFPVLAAALADPPFCFHSCELLPGRQEPARSGLPPVPEAIDIALGADAGPSVRWADVSIRPPPDGEYQRLAQTKRLESMQWLSSALQRNPPDEDRAHMLLRFADLLQQEGTYHAALGDQVLAQDSWRHAIRVYEVILRDYPGYAHNDQALFYQGSAQQALGESEAAIDAFRSLIEDHPESDFLADSYFRLGEAYFDAQNYEPARNAYHMASSFPTAPHRAYSMFMLAWAGWRNEEFDVAEDAFRELLGNGIADLWANMAPSDKEGLRDAVFTDLVRLSVSRGALDTSELGVLATLDPSVRLAPLLLALGRTAEAKVAAQLQQDRIAARGASIDLLRELASKGLAGLAGQLARDRIAALRTEYDRAPTNPGNLERQLEIISLLQQVGSPAEVLVQVLRLERDFGRRSAWGKANRSQRRPVRDALRAQLALVWEMSERHQAHDVAAEARAIHARIFR